MNIVESIFQKAALVSRLLTEQDLKEALAAMHRECAEGATASIEVTDELLADRLIEMRRLNRWQAEQLKLGNTRFHLKDYQIIDSLGQGGMGQVFKAEHSVMGRVVAIKVLPKGRSTEEAVENFKHEIRVLANLDHPNLVRAYDAGHDGNVHFLVTEFVPGSDLRHLVRSGGKLNQQDAATIVTATAMGLQHAHEQGLIHRDIKPGNVMVTPEGMVKVLDLGLAGFLQPEMQGNEAEKLTDQGQARIVGTADYLAPEIIEGGAASATSDIYALGCTLYYAVTRKVPFPGGSSVQKCQRHLCETPMSPRRFNTELSKDFVTMISAMIEKDPKKRIQSAAEVIDRLALWTNKTMSVTVHGRKSGDSPAFARTSVPPPLHDSVFQNTEEFPSMKSADSESHSQLSQGTDRPTHGSQTTLPELKRGSNRSSRRRASVLTRLSSLIVGMSDLQYYLLVASLVLFVLVLLGLLVY